MEGNDKWKSGNESVRNKGAVEKGGQTVESIDLKDAWETSNIDHISST